MPISKDEVSRRVWQCVNACKHKDDSKKEKLFMDALANSDTLSKQLARAKLSGKEVEGFIATSLALNLDYRIFQSRLNGAKRQQSIVKKKAADLAYALEQLSKNSLITSEWLYTDSFLQSIGIKTTQSSGLDALSLPIVSTINKQQYFDDSLQWAKDFFGVPVISAVVHRDESAPHMHVLLLPLSDGRMQGDKVVGNRLRLLEMQDSFHRMVGHPHGLQPPRKNSKLDSATRQKAAELFYNAIVDKPELLLKAEVESAVMDAYSKNPEALLASIGIRPPTRPPKSFAEIMCKPCKPEFSTYSRISFPDPMKMTNPYVSVGLPSDAKAATERE